MDCDNRVNTGEDSYSATALFLNSESQGDNWEKEVGDETRYLTIFKAINLMKDLNKTWKSLPRREGLKKSFSCLASIDKEIKVIRGNNPEEESHMPWLYDVSKMWKWLLDIQDQFEDPTVQTMTRNAIRKLEKPDSNQVKEFWNDLCNITIKTQQFYCNHQKLLERLNTIKTLCTKVLESSEAIQKSYTTSNWPPSYSEKSSSGSLETHERYWKILHEVKALLEMFENAVQKFLERPFNSRKDEHLQKQQIFDVISMRLMFPPPCTKENFCFPYTNQCANQQTRGQYTSARLR